MSRGEYLSELREALEPTYDHIVSISPQMQQEQDSNVSFTQDDETDYGIYSQLQQTSEHESDPFNDPNKNDWAEENDSPSRNIGPDFSFDMDW